MRILLLDGAPAFGGQARHVLDLALGLRDRGHEVAASCNHQKLYAALRAEEVQVLQARFRHGPDVPTIIRLARAVRRTGFDVVHTHGVRAGLIGRLAARLAGCPRVVHTVHTMAEDLVRGQSLAATIGRRAYVLSDRLLARWTDTIVTVSSDLRRRTIREGVPEEKVVTIHSGIDPSHYRECGDRCLARKKLTIPLGCRVVGTAARFTRQKNLGDLIRAARIVSRQLGDAVFVLVGDGEDMPALKRLSQDLGIAHRVMFPGYRTDLPDILPAFDVFAISSLWEGNPLAVLEAMAVGLPVVVPNITGIDETVVDGVTGRIVSGTDPEVLAEGICSILGDGRAAAMGAAGRNRAIGLFGLDRMIEKTERVYLGGIADFGFRIADLTPSAFGGAM